MPRFFTDDILDSRARITGSDVRHISRVLRLHAGDALTLCDGAGNDYDAVITEITDGAVACTTGAPYPSETEPDCRITLFQCLPKAGKMETILQKCTELGAHRFVPVLSRRCVAQPTDKFESRRIRWQRVVTEAGKQSRRGLIPAVEPLVLPDGIDPAAFDLVLIAYEDEHKTSLRSVLQAHRGVKSVGLLIGPEGGFEPSEVDALTARGALAVSLGRRILRTETAGMAAVAQILYEVEP